MTDAAATFQRTTSRKTANATAAKHAPAASRAGIAAAAAATLRSRAPVPTMVPTADLELPTQPVVVVLGGGGVLDPLAETSTHPPEVVLDRRRRVARFESLRSIREPAIPTRRARARVVSLRSGLRDVASRHDLNLEVTKAVPNLSNVRAEITRWPLRSDGRGAHEV